MGLPDLKNPFRAVNIHAFYVGRWVTAVHRAGIAWVAWKDLRHTCGVRLVNDGLSAADITRCMRPYVYRACREGRPLTPRRQATLPNPFVTEHGQDGELRAVMSRDLTQQPVTFGEAARLYAVHHLRDQQARRDFTGLYRQFWTSWQDRPFQSLTRKEIRVWYAELGAIPGRANKALTFLRSLYNWALNFELVTNLNPAQRIPRFSSFPRERCLTAEEVQRMMQGLPHVPDKARAYLLVLLFTAARRSEARLMRWADLDEPLRLWKKPRTKNGTSQVVPFPVQVMSALQRLPRTSRWVFPGKKDRPWSEASTEKTWGVIRRRWGLDDVRLHDLRRTCASYISMHGENLSTVQHVLNHRSLAPTSIYARLNTKAVDRALQAQADRFSALQAGITIEDAGFPSQREPLGDRT